MNTQKSRDLFGKACQYIREYLAERGWKDFDPEMLTNNMLFVIDPITEQNLPIDYAFTIQSCRDLVEIHKKYKENEQSNDDTKR